MLLASGEIPALILGLPRDFPLELLHVMERLGVHIVWSSSVLTIFGGIPRTLLITNQECPQIVSVTVYVVQSNFLYYRSLACNSLVAVEIKLIVYFFLRSNSLIYVIININYQS